jgi:hypothetical protein
MCLEQSNAPDKDPVPHGQKASCRKGAPLTSCLGHACMHDTSQQGHSHPN